MSSSLTNYAANAVINILKNQELLQKIGNSDPATIKAMAVADGTKAGLEYYSMHMAECQSRFNQMPTAEELEFRNTNGLRIETAFTILPALGSFVCDLANKAYSIVINSCKSEYRGRYGILRDYTQERDVLSACQTLRRAIDRYSDSIQSQVNRFKTASGIISRPADGPELDDLIMSRLEESDAEFAADYKAIRTQLIAQFRPYKCYDPQVLYPLLNAIFLAERFKAIANYFIMMCPDELSGHGVLASITRLDVIRPLIQLVHRLNLTDKQSHPMHFIFDKEELYDYQRQSAKRSFQIRHRDNPPTVVNVRTHFHSDDMLRPTWQLETHMLQVSTIDRIIAASSGHDPHFRDDVSFVRLQSCSNTFEQASLNRILTMHQWHELPERMRAFIDSVNARPAIDPRRRPKPVIGYKLTARRDSRGRVIYLSPGQPDFTSTFMGIWHSSGEAEREMGVPHSAILRSVRCKGINDGRNHVWLSLPDFLSMSYNALCAAHPDIADRFRALIPELQIRTCAQIAAEPKAN